MKKGDDSDSSDNKDDKSDDAVAPRRYPKRNRKKKTHQTIYFKNKTFQLSDDIIHINPDTLEETREAFKVVDGLYIPVLSDENANDDSLIEDHVIMHVLGMILVQQYSVQKGIKLFGNKGKESVSKELQQIHDMNVYTPVHAHMLTREERKKALSSLVFLTKKRCGRIKTCNCMNGSKQPDYIKKDNAASPTVATDSVMVTTAIEAHEKQKVATLDIPGAFLHALLDKEVVMILRGILINLMVAIDPELYGPYVIE